MNSGIFDTYITIEHNTGTVKNDYNEITAVWATYVTAWAKKDYATVRESQRASELTATTNNVFTIRYQSGITPKMRIKDAAGLIYDIKGIKEVGRNSYLIIETEINDNQ